MSFASPVPHKKAVAAIHKDLAARDSRKPLSKAAGPTPSVHKATFDLAANFAEKYGSKKDAADLRAQANTHSQRRDQPEREKGLLEPPAKTAKERFQEASKKTSGATLSLPGAGRVLLGHAEGLGNALLPWHQPATIGKTAKFIGESALGLAALGTRAQRAADPRPEGVAGKHNRKGEGNVELTKSLIKSTADHYSKKLGPAYRGEKGGVKHLAQEVYKDPAGSALDVVSVVAPVDAALTGAARGARIAAGKPGIKYTDVRPPIRKSATQPAEPQRTAKTMSGATVLKGTDAARRATQAAAKRKAVREEAKATKGRRPNKKPLPAVRAAAKPGEVLPIRAKAIANRGARSRGATTFAQGGARADFRTNQVIEPIVEAAKKTKIDNHYAARIAAQFGLKDAAGARAFLPVYIKSIEDSRDAALAKSVTKNKVKGQPARVERALQESEGELPALRELLANPQVFDELAASDLPGALGRAGRAVEDYGIVSPERASLGRSQPRGRVLGVTEAKDLNATGRKAQVAGRRAAQKEAKTAYKERDKAREVGARVLAKERAGLAKAKGRAEVLTRNVTGKERVPGSTARLVKTGEKTYQGAAKPREEFVASLPKAGADETPTVTRLSENLRPGEPGVSVEREWSVDPRADERSGQKKFYDELPGSVVVVKRDAQGTPIGVLHMLVGKEGSKSVKQIAVAVDEAHRGQGVAKALVERATAEGFDLSKSADAYTQAGAGLRHSIESKHSSLRVTTHRVEPALKPRYAGGGLGVRQAEQSLARAQAAVDAKVGGATERLQAAKAQLKEARKPAPRIKESGVQYAAREQSAADKMGLGEAQYVHADLGDRLVPTAARPGTPKQGKNALSKNRKRTGVLTELGRNEATIGDTTKVIASEIRKGTLDQDAGRMLRAHGRPVASAREARDWARSEGISDEAFKNDLKVWEHVEPGTDKPSLFLVDKPTFDQWEALRAQEGTLTRGAVGKLRKIASGAQAVLLGSNPGWWSFQRVNNAIALTAGRTNPANLKLLYEVRKSMSPAEREALATFTGGPSTRSFVGVNMFDDLGTLQKIIDNDPKYRAFEKGKSLAATLLRSDAKIEHSVREVQLLNNLAKQIGPDVRTVLKSFKPAGDAMASGDTHMLTKLLTDEKYIKELEQGVEALNRVHGSWASLTAKEKQFKSFVAFYGFLRYATKLAFSTLPVRHPLLTAMLLQEGAAENKYYESVLGKDYPYARGTLLSPTGRSLGSMKRALPVAGGALDLAQAVQSGNILSATARGLSPAVAVLMNTGTGQKLGLDASGEGRASLAKFAGNEPIGGLFSSNRAKFLANQTLGLLGPIQAYNATDKRLQTDESLFFARSYKTSKTAQGRAEIRRTNEERQKQGGLRGALRVLAPIPFGTSGSGEEIKPKADKATKAAQAGSKPKSSKGSSDPTKAILDDLGGRGAESAILKDLGG